MPFFQTRQIKKLLVSYQMDNRLLEMGFKSPSSISTKGVRGNFEYGHRRPERENADVWDHCHDKSITFGMFSLPSLKKSLKDFSLVRIRISRKGLSDTKEHWRRWG
jgi:hypothetical protein